MLKTYFNVGQIYDERTKCIIINNIWLGWSKFGWNINCYYVATKIVLSTHVDIIAAWHTPCIMFFFMFVYMAPEMFKFICTHHVLMFLVDTMTTYYLLIGTNLIILSTVLIIVSRYVLIWLMSGLWKRVRQHIILLAMFAMTWILVLTSVLIRHKEHIRQSACKTE